MFGREQWRQRLGRLVSRTPFSINSTPLFLLGVPHDQAFQIVRDRSAFYAGFRTLAGGFAV
jgi:hypothetical protein